MNAWAFWHQRQPSSKQRILDAETNNISDDCGIARIEDLAYNAICVYWHPLQKPALISVAIQCLSTDFSLQKGVKGLPMHLQIDTYVKNPGDGEYDIVHRGYCQGGWKFNVFGLDVTHFFLILRTNDLIIGNLVYLVCRIRIRKKRTGL